MSRTQPSGGEIRSRHLHPARVEAGAQAFVEAGVDETNYQNEVLKDRLLKSIAFVYWQALTAYADAERLVPKLNNDELIDQAIGRRLGVHASTSGRWVRGETLPTADKVFGTVVVVLRRELSEIGFPTNREVAWRTVSRTLSLVREVECRRDRRAITREEFTCVWLLGRHPDADAMLGGKPAAARQAVSTDVFNELRRRFPGVTSSRFVQVTAGEWIRPYLFFALGLLRDWEFLNDDTVAAV